MHVIDKASPALMHACATGAHLKDATITHRKAGKGQAEYLIVKLSDILITGVNHGVTPRQRRDREPFLREDRAGISAAEG